LTSDFAQKVIIPGKEEKTKKRRASMAKKEMQQTSQLALTTEEYSTQSKE